MNTSLVYVNLKDNDFRHFYNGSWFFNDPIIPGITTFKHSLFSYIENTFLVINSYKHFTIWEIDNNFNESSPLTI